MSVTDVVENNSANRNKNSADREKVASSFYSKNAYLTPLERRKLKRLNCEVSSPPEPDKVKKIKKSHHTKKSSAKENLRKIKPQSKTASGKISKDIETGHRLSKINKDIDPSVFLSKKDVPTTLTANRKFFKFRSLQQGVHPSRTCKSIIPVNMKAVESVIHDRKKIPIAEPKKAKKTTSTPTIHHVHLPKTDESEASDAVHPQNDLPSPQKEQSTAIPLKKIEAADTRWVKNSFADDGIKNFVDDGSSSSLHHFSDGNTKTAEDSCSVINTKIQCESRKSQMKAKTCEKHANSKDKMFYAIFNKSSHRKSSEKTSSVAKVSSVETKKMKTFNPDDKDQLMIDAGQKHIGATQCSTCSMIYHIANDEDEDLHKKFHDSYLASLKFPGWKREKVIGKFLDGRVIMVTNQEPNFMMKKVEDILSIVNRDLGFANPGMPSHPEAAILLYISLSARVIGLLIAEPINSAYPALLDEESGDLSPLTSIDGKKSDEDGKVKALCGVNRIWVDQNERKNKIASRMVDCLRCNFYYGYPILNSDLAYLDPSLAGKRFAAKYNDSSKFLVYK